MRRRSGKGARARTDDRAVEQDLLAEPRHAPTFGFVTAGDDRDPNARNEVTHVPAAKDLDQETIEKELTREGTALVEVIDRDALTTDPFDFDELVGLPHGDADRPDEPWTMDPWQARTFLDRTESDRAVRAPNPVPIASEPGATSTSSNATDATASREQPVPPRPQVDTAPDHGTPDASAEESESTPREIIAEARSGKHSGQDEKAQASIPDPSARPESAPADDAASETHEDDEAAEEAVGPLITPHFEARASLSFGKSKGCIEVHVPPQPGTETALTLLRVPDGIYFDRGIQPAPGRWSFPIQEQRDLAFTIVDAVPDPFHLGVLVTRRRGAEQKIATGTIRVKRT